MKFYNYQFPNINILGNNGQLNIQFKDGMYETDDKYEVEVLKSIGFAFEEEKKKPTKAGG